ncbi:MAG: glutathione S-transferase N-terminal domain-containing protein [Candidatus Paceibacterota bacterium]
MDRLHLEVNLQDTTEAEVRAELEAIAGKHQVPFLVDEKLGVSMFESDDIVSHLQKNYGVVSTVPRVRMHISDNACVSCEG